MAATETIITNDRRPPQSLGQLRRYTETGDANTELVTTITPSSVERILEVGAIYSAAPTQAGVTVERDSGAGPAFDATLQTGSANAQQTVWQPTAAIFFAGDSLRITAPAAGSEIVASIYVLTERP